MAEFLGDYTAEFKRGKDKRPRKRRMNDRAIRAAVVGAAALQSGMLGVSAGAATSYFTIRKAIMARRRRQSAKGIPTLAQKLKSGKVSEAAADRSVRRAFKLAQKTINKAALRGGALGVGAYGAYVGAKALRDRRKKR